MNPMQHELLVNQAAEGLTPEQFTEFRLLARELRAHEKRWGLFLLKYQHTDERRIVADAINKLIPRHTTLVVSAGEHPDWPSLELAICKAAETADVVQLFELDGWLDTGVEPVLAEKRLRAWNVRREGFAANVSIPVICWLRQGTVKSFAETAPDLWSWRAAVHDFSAPRSPENAGIAEMMVPFTGEIDNRSLAQRTLRLREIQQYLQEHPAQDAQQLQLSALLMREIANIHIGMGEFDEALRLYREQLLPIYEKLGDKRKLAYLKGNFATILCWRNQFDEALRIAETEILPIFEQTNDLHNLAQTYGIIADIMQARQDFNNALIILQEKVLPFFKILGDTRAYMITKVRIADSLTALGDPDSALLIYRDEALPFFEKIDDYLQKTTTLGRIAYIQQLRGEFDEALLTYRKVLPIAEKLGDVHSRATTFNNMALIFQERGEATEALRIYREEVLPTFERMGDKPNIAKVKKQINTLVDKQLAPTSLVHNSDG